MSGSTLLNCSIFRGKNEVKNLLDIVFYVCVVVCECMVYFCNSL